MTLTPLNLGLIIFRLLDLHQVLYEQLKAVNAFFIVALMVVCSMNDFVRRLAKTKKSSHKLKPEVVTLYRELQLWAGYTNLNFCHFAIPPLIFFGIIFIVVTLFGSIRIVGKMSWISYPSIPISSLMSFLFVITLLPYAAKAYENSRVYVRQLNQNLRKKYDIKLARTLRPLAIEIGPFGRIDKKLMPEIIKHLTDYTTELLITF